MSYQLVVVIFAIYWAIGIVLIVWFAGSTKSNGFSWDFAREQLLDGKLFWLGLSIGYGPILSFILIRNYWTSRRV